MATIRVKDLVARAFNCSHTAIAVAALPGAWRYSLNAVVAIGAGRTTRVSAAAEISGLESGVLEQLPYYVVLEQHR